MVSRNPVGASKFYTSGGYEYSPRQQQNLYNMGFSLLAGPILTSYAANMYSNKQSMDYNTYLRGGYERQLADWHKNVPGREIKYPELSYEGKIRGADLGITQAISSAYRDTSSTVRSLGYSMGAGYRASRSLYNGSGRSSRYL